MARARFATLACLICLLLAWSPARAAATFVVGVLPIHGARVLVQRYEPLRAYLEASLKQPVAIESASDFARFHTRTLAGGYDLTITPAHFARLAEKDAGYQPVVQLLPDHDALLVSSADQPIADYAQLKGKQLAVIDRLAITVMAALHFLEQQGLEPGVDFQVVEHRTHASVAHALLTGLAVAGVTSSQGMLQIPEDLRARIVVRKHIADIPAFVFLAKPGLDPASVARLKALLLAFPHAPQGRDFLHRTGYTAIVPADMKRADPYLAQTRKALAP